MEKDEIDPSRILKPSFQIKLFLSVAWLVFMVMLNGVDLVFGWDVFMAVGTCLLVIGWFIYPYPFNKLKTIGDNNTNEESDNEEETIKYT